MKEAVPTPFEAGEREEFLYNRWLLRYQRKTAGASLYLLADHTFRVIYDADIPVELGKWNGTFTMDSDQKSLDNVVELARKAESAICDALGTSSVKAIAHAVSVIRDLQTEGHWILNIETYHLLGRTNMALIDFPDKQKVIGYRRTFELTALQIRKIFAPELSETEPYNLAVELLEKYTDYDVFERVEILPEQYQEELENFHLDGKFPVGLAGELLDQVLTRDIADGSVQARWEDDREKIILLFNAAFLANPDDMFLHEYFLKNKKSIYPREF